MGRKGGNSGFPSWWKGRKLYDAIDGSEIFELASTTVIQRGMYMHKKNFDSLTEEQRQASIVKRSSGGRTLAASSGAPDTGRISGLVVDDSGNIIIDDSGNLISGV